MKQVSRTGRANDVTCVILNWNGGERLCECLASLLRSDGVSLSVVLIDNGSTDGSSERAVRRFARIRLIKNKRNLGFAAGNNVGIREALRRKSRHVLLLNDDAFVEPSTLKQLLASLEEHPRAGAVTPRITDGNGSGRVWFDGGYFTMFWDTRHRNMGRRIDSLPGEAGPFRQQFATACCLLIRSRVFPSVGLLDERYFMYGEDADFSMRMQQAGFELLHCPGAVITHEQSADTKQNRGRWFRDYFVTRNKLLFAGVHLRGVRRFLHLSHFFTRHVVLPLGVHAARGDWRRARAVLEAVVDGMKGCFGEKYS